MLGTAFDMQRNRLLQIDWDSGSVLQAKLMWELVWCRTFRSSPPEILELGDDVSILLCPSGGLDLGPAQVELLLLVFQ